MTFKVEYKNSPTSSWAGVGSGYSEGQALTVVKDYKKRHPQAIVRIIDMKTKQVISTS